MFIAAAGDDRMIRGRMSDWLVYILECGDKSLYTGITTELKGRIAAHENGAGAKFTRGRGPFRVVYTEEQPSRGAALKRELEIKSMRRPAKRALIASAEPGG
jgi:putative endonuclease